MSNKIFENLNENGPIESQNQAIREFVSMGDLDPNIFIQPLGKEYWENAAKILSIIGFPGIDRAIPGLFGWLQDLNWPGALQIMRLLSTLPKDDLIRHLEIAANKACDSNDHIWLANLSSFIETYKLQEYDFQSREVYIAMLLAKEIE